MAISIINVSSLDGSNGFRLDEAGGSVSSAGDVNGDGFDDVIIGVPYADPNGYSTGSSYVVFGKAAGFDATLDLSSLDGSNGFRLDGVAVRDKSGRSVSNAGDVNGDGFDDVIIGASGADPNGAYSGSSYVVFGKASGFDASLNLSNLDGSNGFRLDGALQQDYLGGSVSNAGDVNGDGFDDVIVGARGASFFGASYVVFGKASDFAATLDLSSLNGNNGFRLDGRAGFEDWGFAVSSTGDVNGDGFDDLIVGAYNSDSSYVVFGKASGFSATLDLSSLNGSNGFRLRGRDNYDYLGRSVSSAGDVNGDGFDDLIIGARDADPYGIHSAGSSYVVFGKASGFDATLVLSSLDGDNGFRLDGVSKYDNSSTSVSSAGDVNGDGFDDVIVGAYRTDTNGNYNSGSSYVVFGKASGFSAILNLSSIDGSNGFRLDGVAANDHLGHSVSNAGDVNGDGFDDLIVGASGASYVVFGGNFTGEAVYFGTSGDDNFTGSAGAERFEASDGNDKMTGGGGADVFHGDAGDDIIGVPDLNFQFVDGGIGSDTLELMGGSLNLSLASFHGTINGIETIDLTGNGDNTLTLTLQELLSLSDTTHTFIVNGNGGDRVVGLIDGWTDGGLDGNYHIYTNGGTVLRVDTAVSTDAPTRGLASIANLNGSNGFRLDGAGESDFSGRSVSNAGDVNGDGFDDVIVGADGSGGYDVGSSYVVFGKAAGFSATLSLSSLDGGNGFRLDGIAQYDSAALVSSVGDVNGDGFDDVIIGASGADSNGKSSGSSYVVFGKASGFDATLDLSNLDGNNGFRLDGVSKYDNSGISVSSAGDVNGDGFDDVIVGAPGADSNGIRSGFSYVVFGKASGFSAALALSSLDGNSGFRLDGVAADDRLGNSVSNAGDVNGDGFADLLVGAVGADLNGSYSGSSYVVFGKASGFNATLDLSNLDNNSGFRLDGAVEGDVLGGSVSSAGDVNGDGFDDLIVGAPGADSNGSDSGSSYVIFGSSNFVGGNVIEGTSGDDSLKGTSAAEIFEAGDGNDSMIGRGGADVFHGGAGDDHIRVSDLDFDLVDGGAGNDVLHIGGSDLNLDLASFDGKISGIETICLYGSGDNTLTLTAADLLKLSDTTNTLRVNGNDHIVGLSNGWTDGGVRGAGYYHVYTQGEAVLLVGINVTTDFV